MANSPGVISRGIVTGYDPNTMTATIVPYDGSGVLQNVVCQFSRYDPRNGAFAITPPSINSPCLFTRTGEETFILGTFPPINANAESNNSVSSPLNATVNRGPSAMRNSGTLPGNPSATTSMGAEETFTDNMKKIIMSPGKLASIWNLLNCIWENWCSIFRLRSGPADVFCEVGTDDTTNTTINVRRTAGERSGISVVNLNIGQTADVIQLNINGAEFLHVDADRNTTITAKNVNLTGTNITFNGDTFDCLNVSSVKLP
jgi:hypothetical protein